MTTFKFDQKVSAPLGVAYITATDNEGSWLVRYSKKDYTPVEWERISPGNGPCVFRMYAEDEITDAQSSAEG